MCKIEILLTKIMSEYELKENYNLWLILLPQKNIDVTKGLLASSFNPSKDAIVICEPKSFGRLSEVSKLLAAQFGWPIKSVKSGDPVSSKGVFQLEEEFDFSSDNMMMISTTVFPNQSPHIIVEDNQVCFQVKETLDTDQAAPLFNSDEMSQIACALSHDVRAPVRHITQFAKLATETDDLPEEVLDYLDIISSSGRNMNEQLEALVKYIRLNLQAPKLMQIDLPLCLENVKNRLADSISKDALKIQLDCAEPVWSDSELLGEVFYQLIDNSIKFSKDNALLEVAIVGKKEGENLVFEYRDNSAGFSYLPSDTYTSVFQKLHSKEGFRGAGIGLSLCRKIMHGLKGTFVIDDSDEPGVKIKLQLPAGPAV